MKALMWHWKNPGNPALQRAGAWGLWLALVGVLMITAKERPGVSVWWAAEKGKLANMVASSWWWGGVASAVLGFGLLLTARWWAGPWSAVAPGPVERAPRWLMPTVLGLILIGLAVRLPRLNLSLYNDESHAFRAHIAGEIPKAQLGNPDKFRPVSWLSTFYENRAGNNSMPFSVLARLSYDAWRAATGAPSGRVNEASLRLPVLGCGVLSIGAMAWLGLRLGGPGLALLAALLTTFHPWHMRYSVEARSYGILLLLLPLSFVAFDAALRSGRWAHWLRFGLMQYALLACWFGSAHLLMGWHLAVAAYAVEPVWRHRKIASVRWNLLVPAWVSGVLALGLYLQFNLAHFVQLSKALADPGFFKDQHPFPMAWFQDVAGFLGFGIPGLRVETGTHAQPSVVSLLATPWAAFLSVAVLCWIVGLVVGVAKVARARPTGFALAGATAGGGLLVWTYCTAKGILYLKWYALFLVPGLLMLLAAGLHRLAKGRRWAGLLLCLPLLAAWMPGLSYYSSHGRENLRGAVELARGASYPLSLTNPNRTLYAITWSESPIYDPAAVTLKTPEALQALMAQAGQENRPLYVAYGHSPEAHMHSATILALLENPSLFRLVTVLPGLDETAYHHYLYQWMPRAPARE